MEAARTARKSASPRISAQRACVMGLVVARCCLGRRRKDRLRQPRPVEQPCGQSVVEDRPRRLVFLPPTPSEVATHHRLDGQRRQLAHKHRPRDERLVATEGARESDLMVGHEMDGEYLSRLREPPETELSEEDALARHAIGHDHIEGRQPVGRHDQEVFPEVEDLAHLARGHLGIGQSLDGHQRLARQVSPHPPKGKRYLPPGKEKTAQRLPSVFSTLRRNSSRQR